MAIPRLLWILSCAVMTMTPILAQVPEGGTAGKIDRSQSLRPINIGKPEDSAATDLPAIPREPAPPAPQKEPVPMDIVIESPAKPTPRKGFLIESTVVNPKVFFPIEGAEKTVLAAATEWEYGVKTYTREDWTKVDPREFAKESIALADSLLEKVEPRFVRDHRNVIAYGIISTDDPFVSSIIISKKFIPRFESKLGDHVHALVIDRRTLYLFPADGNALESFAASLLEQYGDATEPVSLEIFSITKTGYKVIGNISP